jgi:HK97 family phage prohead protease
MENRVAEVRSWVEENDPQLFRSFPFEIEELRDSGNGIPGSYAIKGLAAVYNKWSLDLGGFRERILPGAFDRVLSEDPHVLHTWDHDTAKTLSSTRSKTFPLELKSLSKSGLGFYSRVAPTTDAANLRILMEGDVIDQSSFAFTVRNGEWRFLEDEDVLERDIIEVEGLYDVTTCAMGAYPQTDSEIAVRSLMKSAKRSNGGVFFPANANASTSTATQSFSTRTSGAEGNADPAPDPDPVKPDEEGAAGPAAPVEDVDPPATSEAQLEEQEAKEREFKLWQQKRAAEHRRTREFAYGVPNSEGGKET